jgi:hypothetical protein
VGRRYTIASVGIASGGPCETAVEQGQSSDDLRALIAPIDPNIARILGEGAKKKFETVGSSIN